MVANLVAMLTNQNSLKIVKVFNQTNESASLIELPTPPSSSFKEPLLQQSYEEEQIQRRNDPGFGMIWFWPFNKTFQKLILIDHFLLPKNKLRRLIKIGSFLSFTPAIKFKVIYNEISLEASIEERKES